MLGRSLPIVVVTTSDASILGAEHQSDEAMDGLEETDMSTILDERIETGDVIEMERDGELISALVLLATDEALILDACDDTTPFVVRRGDLMQYRLFQPEAA
jgi:hypothetical protein